MPIIPNDTLSSIVKLVNRDNLDSVVQPPLSRAGFTLDSSGIIGFFGDESAFRAMSTLNLVRNRRWLGWYNSPGSYEVAKQFSRLANSHIFDGLFPVDDRDPAKALMLDGRVGPECTPLYPPTISGQSRIGHLGSLIARKVSQMSVKKVLSLPKKNSMHTCRVTFVKLNRILTDELNELDLVPSSSIIFTVFTILISIGGCVVCALMTDWFCLASIAIGILASGVASLAIGSGKIYLRHNPPIPSQVYAPGDILLRTDTDIVILVGNQAMVRPLTHGRFSLHFGEMPHFTMEKAQSSDEDGVEKRGDSEGEAPMRSPPIPVVSWPRAWNQKYIIDISVIILLSQFLVQLLLIPQGTLFGQLMFIGTLVPSWVYHSYLSSLSLDLQMQALFHTLRISDMSHYQLHTWTQAAVFACLVFRSIHLPVWHSSTSNAYEQRGEEELEVKAVEWMRQWEEIKREVKAKEQDYERAAREVEEAVRAQEDADAEVKVAQAGVEEARAEVKKAAEEVNAVEEDVKEVEEKVAEAEMSEAQKAKAQDQVNKAQFKKVEAKTLVADKKEEAKKWREEVKKWKREVKKKMEEATRKVEVKHRKDCEANMARVEAERAKATMLNMMLKKAVEDEKEAKKKQDHDKIVRQKEKEDEALQALLDALLPGQTDVLRAFKQSVVRKLSKVSTKSSWAYMESDWTLEFCDEDTFVGVNWKGGLSESLVDEDLNQLYMYQEDAKSAFAAWKIESIGDIASQFSHFTTS